MVGRCAEDFAVNSGTHLQDGRPPRQRSRAGRQPRSRARLGAQPAAGLVGLIRLTSHKLTDITCGYLQLADLWYNDVVEKVSRTDDEGC
jgi:hypothetical protein